VRQRTLAFISAHSNFTFNCRTVGVAIFYLRLMGRIALGCFEERDHGVWVCTKATTVAGPSCTVAVELGRRFTPRTVYAGYNDFTGYLASVAVQASEKRAAQVTGPVPR
jgi:hypothetical protein